MPTHSSVPVVKKRGYRWDAANRYWYTIVSDDEYAVETAFLNALCGTAAAKNVFEKSAHPHAISPIAIASLDAKILLATKVILKP